MKKFRHSKRLFILLALTATGVLAQDDNEQFETVEKLTNIICDDYQNAGSEEGFELDGEASAELVILTKKLASAGFEGAGKIFSNEYVGLRQEDLANEKISVRSCKMSVWSDFIAMKSNIAIASEDISGLESDKYLLGLSAPKNILDGQATIELVRIGTQGPFKIAYLAIEAPNRPRQTIASSPKSRNFPNLQEFEYRNEVYTVDVLDILLEDQEVALNILKSK